MHARTYTNTHTKTYTHTNLHASSTVKSSRNSQSVEELAWRPFTQLRCCAASNYFHVVYLWDASCLFLRRCSGVFWWGGRHTYIHTHRDRHSTPSTSTTSFLTISSSLTLQLTPPMLHLLLLHHLFHFLLHFAMLYYEFYICQVRTNDEWRVWCSRRRVCVSRAWGVTLV